MRGIVLEGGGAKGSFQVGAMKAIKECGIDYDVVVGASIGAINGAIIAMDDIKLLEAIWRSASASDLIKGDVEVLQNLLKLDFSGDPKKLRDAAIEVVRQGGIDVTPLKKILRDYIDEKRIRESSIRYGLVTLSLSDLKPIEIFVEDIPEGKLHDYIIASSNFPAFKQEKIDNRLLVDGGMFDNLPINMLINDGVSEIIAIRINGIGRKRRVKKTDAVTITTIEPSESLGGTLEFDPERALYNIKLGYYDALRVLKGLKGKYYYLTDVPDESEIISQLMRIDESSILSVGQLLGVDMAPRRMVFEAILPAIAELTKCSDKASYSDIMIALYEFLGQSANIDRFECLTFKALEERVNDFYLKEPVSTIDDLSRQVVSFISTKGLGILPTKLKKELLIQVFKLFLEGVV